MIMEYKYSSLFKWSSGKPVALSNEGNIPVYGSNGIVGYSQTGKYCNKIILGRVGAYCGSVEYCAGKFNATDNTLITECNEDLIDYRYAYYMLKVANLNYFSAGAAQPLITQSILKRIRCDIPSLPTQKRIADILSTYDDMIENNNRRIVLLEKAAQELYKEWFVRFRFPGHETVKFENGIPENWRISTVKETFDIFDTKRIPLSSMDRDKMRKVYPYYGAAELMDYVDDYIFDGIYLLLGEDGSVITPAGKPVLQYVWGKMWVNNHAHVLQGKSPYSTEYLHLMFGQMDITGIVTGAAQPKISQGRLFKKKTILPTNDLVLKFDSLIQPMYKSIRQLREANRNLTKQRDLLLPRLMSGKLEV